MNNEKTIKIAKRQEILSQKRKEKQLKVKHRQKEKIKQESKNLKVEEVIKFESESMKIIERRKTKQK